MHAGTSYTAALGWLTNHPEAAKKLRAAEKRFNKAMHAASFCAFYDKIEAIRTAKAQRQADYDAVIKSMED